MSAVRGPTPCLLSVFQPQEAESHASEQRLQGCGQRPWDHHLENRGELRWRHTLLLILNLGVDSCHSDLLQDSPLAVLSLQPKVLEQWEVASKCTFPYR